MDFDKILRLQRTVSEQVDLKWKAKKGNTKASGLQVMINKTYPVLAELNNMRKSSEMCDLTITVGDVDFQVHRIVLSAVSSYFKALLLGDFTESKEKVVEIKDIEADIMEIIINYAYTSKLSVTESTAMALFVAADRFQVSYIRDEVGRYLEGHVCESTCIELFCLSDLYNCLHLKKKGKNSFTDIYRLDNFLNLTSEMLTQITSSDELIVDKEETVCEAVFLWYQFNPDERKNDFERVFETIRLALLNPYYLVNIVKKYPDINRNAKNFLCYDCVSECWSSVAIPASIRNPIISLTLLDSSNLYVFDRAYVHRYCLKTNKWDKQFPILSRSNYQHDFQLLTTLAHEGKIYIISYDYGANNVKICAYNHGDGTFSPPTVLGGLLDCGPLNACAIDSYIYIVDGSGRKALRYCINTGGVEPLVEPLCPMLQSRNSVGIAAKDGKIFVRGVGTDSIEVYDPHRKFWSFCELSYKDKYPFIAPDEIQRKQGT